ncbi:ubiquinol-cytochrome c reductase subunit 10 [Cryptococcus neoformans]|uniref:Ubiquinol-cytochrome c reductase subunit 10 n=2 Tax=Cryptococcus neoformans TaxID=5207 RepID=A0A854QCK8_CRYNE|nr:ubiquinol-cytochrome c reductase subunit 10 [Cryptococcus neoformans var. grubii H99]AUB23975.1 ubiquinol-cytochrome c reductase subunit 10 [Cryptococcus neoformans var. grubii]OWT40469.1 ubiquinol-cytochrome c reductase subunit 10 [Cryptococcus neoformans var. grubii Bt1]OWZ33451.1 ubiquinol-cytochrome c reductase subunit 10 [Cryptococcus neoformans var. grubii AD2-60a]OWZ45547.1 ubiquinol-cytochrome c reductase subunit 10 [Cryptococcus neoformans var. grubii C23]OWZ47840.1 ubiquinol-cytoc|eukprot:XP_012048484.1 ubiquinol-cytochrome c reductase subunit 10 [Cryptococcus neoformans var. grubii H99]
MPAYIRRTQLGFAGITPERLRFWGPSAAVWGVAAGAAVSFYLSEVPIFQKDVLIKVPVVGSYFKDTTPDSDKPF